jgi:hypothetical protein
MHSKVGRNKNIVSWKPGGKSIKEEKCQLCIKLLKDQVTGNPWIWQHGKHCFSLQEQSQGKVVDRTLLQ